MKKKKQKTTTIGAITAAEAQQMETDLLNIPTELIIIILLRLPMKSLLQLKCVCKYLYSFISSPNFIKIHLDHAINTQLNPNNHNPLLLILDWRRTSGVEHLYDHTSFPFSLKFNSHRCEVHEHDHNDVLRQKLVDRIHWPFESPHQFQFWGSCNGLLCARGISTTDKRQNSLPFIWNPSTQEFKTVPRTSMEYNPKGTRVYLYYDYYGFGYDRNLDDYKVIRFVNRIDGYSKRLDYTTIIKVYTLGTNSWRRIQLDNPFDFHYEVREKKGMLVNGVLHWIMARSSRIWSAKIVSFDIADEEFRVVESPHFIKSFIFAALQVLRECLCVLYLRINEGRRKLEVWLMNDYGVKDSWTKLVTIALPFGSMYPIFFDRPVKILRVCSNDEVLLSRGDKELLVVDAIKGTSRWIRRHADLNLEGSLSTETYIETLVSLKPPATYMGQEQAQGKTKQRKRKNLKKRKTM